MNKWGIRKAGRKKYLQKIKEDFRRERKCKQKEEKMFL